MQEVYLSVSVVIFKPDFTLLARTLESVRRAVIYLRAQHAPSLPVSVGLIDNGNEPEAGLWADGFRRESIHFEVIKGQGNIGYGRAHNLAIERACSRIHLILNPDVELAPDALEHACRFFESHADIGLIAPHVCNQQGATQYLCRRYPTLFDLLLRGFAPRAVQARFARRLADYELRDAIDAEAAPMRTGATSDRLISPSIISGCFMLFRTDVLKKLEGFDARYFLYFEDYDLSLRAGALTNIAYVPTVRIVHFGGDAAKKGMRHICLFSVSALRFFNRFGWRWF